MYSQAKGHVQSYKLIENIDVFWKEQISFSTELSSMGDYTTTSFYQEQTGFLMWKEALLSPEKKNILPAWHHIVENLNTKHTASK